MTGIKKDSTRNKKVVKKYTHVRNGDKITVKETGKIYERTLRLTKDQKVKRIEDKIEIAKEKLISANE